MNLLSRLLITALSAAALVIFDAGEEEAILDPGAVDLVHFHIFGDPVERESFVYARETVALLAAQDYDALEARGRAACHQKQRFADGTWKLRRFYAAMPLSQNDSDHAWQIRIAQVSEWVAARPSSLVAGIALGEVYSAYASKGSTEGLPLEVLQERLEAALRVLENARGLGVDDPHYWRVAYSVAVGLRWPAENIQSIYSESMALEPAYWSNVLTHVPALLAREKLPPAEIEEFAASTAAAAGEDAEEIYARMAWETTEHCGGFLQESPFDWNRVQAGYRSLLKRYPNSPGLLSQYCVLACRARDKDAARKCFAKLGSVADLRAFRTRHEYARHLRWAHWN